MKIINFSREEKKMPAYQGRGESKEDYEEEEECGDEICQRIVNLYLSYASKLNEYHQRLPSKSASLDEFRELAELRGALTAFLTLMPDDPTVGRVALLLAKSTSAYLEVFRAVESSCKSADMFDPITGQFISAETWP